MPLSLFQPRLHPVGQRQLWAMSVLAQSAQGRPRASPQSLVVHLDLTPSQLISTPAEQATGPDLTLHTVGSPRRAPQAFTPSQPAPITAAARRHRSSQVRAS